MGVDGCPGGWIAVIFEPSGQQHFKVLKAISELDNMNPSVVAIDMPIGLPETGARSCDVAARVYLGLARNRVFTGARRHLLQHLEDYERANNWGKSNGAGVSKQLFCILPKVAELDRYMRERDTAFPVRETHPELVYQRLNGGSYLLPKKKPAGQKVRRNLAYANGFSEIDEWLTMLKGTGAKADDLLDACACSLAAASGRRLTSDVTFDSYDLPMEMWY